VVRQLKKPITINILYDTAVGLLARFLNHRGLGEGSYILLTVARFGIPSEKASARFQSCVDW
jgi:hypothetical protein